MSSDTQVQWLNIYAGRTVDLSKIGTPEQNWHSNITYYMAKNTVEGGQTTVDICKWKNIVA